MRKITKLETKNIELPKLKRVAAYARVSVERGRTLHSYSAQVSYYNDLIQKLHNKEWIVYCKEPFKNAECVIQYLGRYTHRVAISNERILEITEDTVKFKWRDYKDNNKMKEPYHLSLCHLPPART